MPSSLADRWCLVNAELRRAVADSTFHLWLEPLRLEAVHGDDLVVGAPPSIHAWVAARFTRVLQACAAAALGEHTTVTVVPLGSGRGSAGAAAPERLAPAPWNPRYTFEQFVIGDGNHLAHAAALAVAELPGHAYNPLFLHGPPGTGKTHLLHAIGNYLACHQPAIGVRYTTIEGFTDEFVESLHRGSLDRFKALYRQTDVLLIDDVQYLERKARTEQEFLHTFATLYETGSQVVITCDRVPRALSELQDRLRERLQSGLVCDIRPPDFGARLTILRKRAERDAVDVADERALELIAHRVTGNVRELEGALVRMVAAHSLTRRPIDVELAGQVLAELGPHERRVRTLAEIRQATADAFGCQVADLVSPDRSARIAWARQVAMYLARELTRETLPAIGLAFGRRNHTTVLHACRRVRERMAADDHARAAVHGLSATLGGPVGDRDC